MRKLLIITMLAALAGCNEKPREQLGNDTVYVGTGGHSAYVRMVTTTDGTRCAVMVGLKRGGITCDWKATKEESK